MLSFGLITSYIHHFHGGHNCRNLREEVPSLWVSLMFQWWCMPNLRYHQCCLLHKLSQGLVGARNKREARGLETSGKRERGMMGTSAEREQGLILPITPFRHPRRSRGTWNEVDISANFLLINVHPFLYSWQQLRQHLVLTDILMLRL